MKRQNQAKTTCSGSAELGYQGSGRPVPAWGGGAFVGLPGPILRQALRLESQNQRRMSVFGAAAPPRPDTTSLMHQVTVPPDGSCPRGGRQFSGQRRCRGQPPLHPGTKSPLPPLAAAPVRRRPWDIEMFSVLVPAGGSSPCPVETDACWDATIEGGTSAGGASVACASRAAAQAMRRLLLCRRCPAGGVPHLR